MTFDKDEQRRAAFARKKGSGKASRKRASLWSRKSSRTGLGIHEKAVVDLLATDLVDLQPSELQGLGVLSMDAWPSILENVELAEQVHGLPDGLDRRAWTRKQEAAVKAAVECALHQRGIHVVATRQDLAFVLAARGQLTEDRLGAFQDQVYARVDSVAEARRLAERGLATYTLQADGRIVAGIHGGGKAFLAFKEASP